MTLPAGIVTPDLFASVLSAMDAATAAEVMPRWRHLAEADIRTKSSAWDLVTDADVEAERLLTLSLRGLIDIPVVGEEATAADPSLLDVVGTASACWVVDPVDGTRNFVAGTEAFACMVALIDGGRTVGAWITYPAVGREAHAGLGVGAFIDGAAFVAPAPADSAALRGAIGAKAAGGPGSDLMARASTLGPATTIRMCAGWDYLDVVTGATDFVSFSRSLPWDHAPGTLIATEAGLKAARHDGSTYWPGDDKTGLLTAHPSVWQRVATTLGPEAATA